MANGGARPGAGRKAGGKNKATIQRELQAAMQVAAAHQQGRELATAILERLLADLERYKGLAEGAAGVHKPPKPDELAAAQAQEDELARRENRPARKLYGGDWEEFGRWFDRAVTTTRDAAMCAKELAKYQQPQIRAVDAPAPPPDPRELERTNRKRFSLRVFEGGKPLISQSA